MMMMPAPVPNSHPHSAAAAAGDEDASLSSKLVADRYLKREVLGEGTYGVVFKAIDTKDISLSDSSLEDIPTKQASSSS